MTLTKEIPFASESINKTGDFRFVCEDAESGQSITFTEIDGQQVTLYSFQESGVSYEVTLTSLEAQEINAWRNSGRRNSYWNWPGWDAVRNRSMRDQ